MRIYRQWGGNPAGDKEDPSRCIADVPDGGRSPLFHQCNRKRGKGPDGLWCGIHARQIALGKQPWTPDNK